MIQIENVSFCYQGQKRPALKNIDLHIRKGELVVLAGKSGCGKTTLIRLLNGLIPDCFEGDLKGKIRVGGEDPQKLKTTGMSAYVGSVFQNPKSQFFNVNSLNELAFPLENRAVPTDQIKDRIQTVAAELHMQHLIGRNMFHLSSGEKQKIAFASAAMSDQPVLVLDEPSSNLDMESVNDLKEILVQWKKEGKTIIISEHRFFFLKELLDRFIIMDQGEIRNDYQHDQIMQLSVDELHQKGIRDFDFSYARKKQRNLQNDPFLIIKDLQFTYPGSDHGIHVENRGFHKGHVVALTGYNGAGKTTFTRCLAGLQKKAKGTVFLNGCKLNVRQMAKYCTMVMQDVNHQLFTDSVYHELEFELRNKKTEDKERKNRIDACLKEMDLMDICEQHPQSVSGGQKQRLAIAAASLSDKPIIMFDEPTSGLDYIHMKQCASLIRNLSEKGKLIFVVSHDLQLLTECCDDVVRIEKGEITDCYPLNEQTIDMLVQWFRNQN